jgi:hypothetical protein
MKKILFAALLFAATTMQAQLQYETHTGQIQGAINSNGKVIATQPTEAEYVLTDNAVYLYSEFDGMLKMPYDYEDIVKTKNGYLIVKEVESDIIRCTLQVAVLFDSAGKLVKLRRSHIDKQGNTVEIWDFKIND